VKNAIVLAVAALALVMGVAAPHTATRADPHGFSTRIDNTWFPLKPGARYTYSEIKDGKPSRDVVVVTHRTKTIQGAPCVAVEDRLWVEGRLFERTTDWYTQDKDGNVWYFGEQTAELDRSGQVTSTEGTWQAGVDGAVPGIYMPAHPTLGSTGRQEYYKGHAEDHFRVIGRFGKNAVLTMEWTPLEPGAIDHKLYVRGVGTVMELAVKGGTERNELLSVTGL
jgi:hypothetical protein